MKIKAVILFLSLSSLSITSKSQLLVIDPGHGGPGASKTNNGGGYNNGKGSEGPVSHTAEQWVNLRVALTLASRMVFEGRPYLLTRFTDTSDIRLQDRVKMANDSNVRGFLSIHHNGLPSNLQGTEVRWCDTKPVTKAKSQGQRLDCQ